MSEFLVAAINLPSGYMQGEPIHVEADGHTWGSEETLPNFWIVKVPSVSLGIAQKVIQELYLPALPGDPELQSPDPEDRRVKRGRRRVRVFIDELPLPKQQELDSVGVTELTLGQARSIYRKMTWNRTTGLIEDTGIGEFG